MQLEMILSAMGDLKLSLQEKLTIWNKYEQVIEKKYQNVDLLRLYSYLIQAALFSEKGISMLELTQNMEKSTYVIKKLMDEIPEEMIVIKKKSNYKFYSISLERLNTLIFQESIEVIQNSK